MKMRALPTAATVLILFLTAALPALADMETVLAPDGAEGDHFGQAVAVDGVGSVPDRFVVIGAPDDDDGGTGTGAAWVFHRRNGRVMAWQKLMSLTPIAGEQFGTSVDVSGDWIVIGGKGGRAHLFRFRVNRWDFEMDLVPSGGQPGSGYGGAVAIDGDLAVVSDSYGGRVHVFARSEDGWKDDGQLVPSGAYPSRFGVDLDIEGDRVIVGSTGSVAHVFIREDGAWREEGRLTAPGVESADAYGTQVAIAGRFAVVGAPQDEGVAKYSGSAHVFRLSGGVWSHSEKLTASDEKYGSRFGWSVAASGSVILIGAYRDELPTAWYGGAAYEFAFVDGEWTEQRKIVSPTAAGGDEFGGAVAVSGNLAVAGASLDNDMGLDSGAAWIFPVDQKFTSSAAAKYGRLGASVSVACDTAVVGAPGEQAAHVYRRFGHEWRISARLAVAEANFGAAAAADGERVVVSSSKALRVYRREGESWKLEQVLPASSLQGALAVSISVNAIAAGGELSGGLGRGLVVFRKDGPSWVEEQVITPPAGGNSSNFGESVSIHGDRIAVGSIDEDEYGPDCGAAYVYARTAGTWTIEDELVLSDAAAGDRTGLSISLYGDRAVVGGVGKATVFERAGSEWRQTHRLSAPGGDADKSFGFFVATSGDTIVVSRYDAPYLARVYTRNGIAWDVQQDLAVAGTPSVYGLGGMTPVAACGNTVLIGMPLDGTVGDQAGAVYSFLGVGAPIPPLAMSGPKIPEATSGVSFSGQFTRTGGLRLPFVWSVVGDGPISDGIDAETGRMDGAYGAAGDYSFTVRVTDGCGSVAERSYSVHVNAKPAIVTGSLPAGAVGRSYSSSLAATGGTGSLRVRLSAGALPAGMTFDPATGVIAGTPTATGRYPLSLIVEDSLGVDSPAGHFTLVVMPVANLAVGKLRSDVGLDAGGERLALELVRGTLLTVAVKFPKGSRDAATLALYGPDGHLVPLGEHLKVKSKSLALKKLEVPSTGRYVLVLTPANGFDGDVRLDVKVKAPKKCAEEVTVAPGTTETARFGALSGATAKILVKAAKGSNVLPAIQAVVAEDGRNLLVAEDLKVKGNKVSLKIVRPLPGGTIRVILAARDGTAGAMTVKVTVKEPAGYAYSRPEDPCIVE